MYPQLFQLLLNTILILTHAFSYASPMYGRRIIVDFYFIVAFNTSFLLIGTDFATCGVVYVLRVILNTVMCFGWYLLVCFSDVDIFLSLNVWSNIFQWKLSYSIQIHRLQVFNSFMITSWFSAFFDTVNCMDRLLEFPCPAVPAHLMLLNSKSNS